jgi:hypothetical protein
LTPPGNGRRGASIGLCNEPGISRPAAVIAKIIFDGIFAYVLFPSRQRRGCSYSIIRSSQSEEPAVFKIAATIAMTAMAVSMTASTAEAGARGLMAGLFIGAVGAHMIDQGYRAQQRREAYEEMQIRKQRAIAAQRAAAAQQARAAEYQRIQAEKANAAKIAAANAAAANAPTTTTTSTSTVTAAATTAQDTTTTVAKTTTSLATTASTDTDNAPTCRKYSAAVGGMIDTVCP